MQGLLLTLYLFSLFGFTLSRGFYSTNLFYILFLNFVFILLLFFAKFKTFFNKIDFEKHLLLVFLVNSLLYVALFGGVYFTVGTAQSSMKFLLPVILFLSAIFLFDFGKLRERVSRLNFIALLFAGIFARLLIIWASPAPKIDTFDLLKYGPLYLARGENPYTQNYPARYVGEEPNYYSYSPLTLYLFLPSDFLFSDPRVTYIVSDLIIVILLYKLLNKTKVKLFYGKYLLPLLFLYHPSGSYILEQSWMDPLVFMTIVLFVYLQIMAKNFKKLSALPLGIFLGLKHTMLILTPLFFLFGKIEKKIVITALIFVGIAYLPFMLWSFGDFYDDLVRFYFSYPVRHDGMTLTSFFFSNFGQDIPKQVMYLSWLILLILIIVKKTSDWSKFILSLAVFLFGFFMFNKLAFVNYYYFISCLILLSIVLALFEGKGNGIEN